MKTLQQLVPRPYCSEEEYARMTDYEKGLLHGGIELWDKVHQATREAEAPSFVKDFDQLSYRQQQLVLTGKLPEIKN